VSASPRGGVARTELELVDSAPAIQRWKFLVAYDGSPFHGFALQPQVPTVAGAIGDALVRLLRLPSPPVITCAGRTDAGVHAIGQVISVDLPAALPEIRGEARSAESLVNALNRNLAPAIVLRHAEPVSQDFNARFSATWRRYRYLIWNAPSADPLLAPIAWHVDRALDERSMTQAAGSLIGRHDFRAFCRRPQGADASEPITREVRSASLRLVEDDHIADLGAGRLFRFEIQANAFCHQMVRSLVAQVVDVGLGRSTIADLVGLLRSSSRQGAAQPAPPHGLLFLAVGYGSDSGVAEQGL